MLIIRPLIFCCMLLVHDMVAAQGTSSAENLDQQIQAMIDLGDKLVGQARFEAATQTLNDAYNLLGVVNNNALARNVLNSLANLHYGTGELAMAERYYRELLSYDENSGDALALSVTLYNLGHVAASQQRFSEADALFNQALRLNLELKDETGRAYTLKALGVNAHASGDLVQARALLKDSSDVFSSVHDDEQRAAVLRNLADVELAAGLPQTAVNYYMEALPVLMQSNATTALLRCYRGLSQAFEQLKQFDKALIALRAYSDLMQAGLEQQNLDSTQRIREELDTRRYADANAVLERTRTEQQGELAESRSLVRMQFLVLLLAAVVVLLVTAMFRRSEKTAKYMKKLASTDELTRLHNRRAIMEKGNHEWLRAVRYKNPLSCLVFDLDHFKSINDNYGHSKGDEVLRALAHQLIATLRQSDCVGRIGGEEFLLFAPGTDAGQAQMLAEKIRMGIANCRIPGMETHKITISIGIATLADEASLEQLIQHADEALYQVKKNGRNRSIVYRKETPGFTFGPALHAIMQRA
ncbi:MAG: diguanylate cyclase [Pseudomonadota bacterium]